MFSSRKEYINVLRQLQNEVFPKLKKCWGNNIWFMIQIRLGFLFHLIYANKIDVYSLKEYTDADLWYNSILSEKVKRSDIKNVLKLFYFLVFKKRKWVDLLKNKTLIISQSTHSVMKDGKRYNIFSDSYKNRLEQCGETYFDFEIDTLENNEIKILFERLKTYSHSLLKIKSKLFKRDFQQVLYNVKLVDNFFADNKLFNHNRVSNYLKDIIVEDHISFLVYKTILRILNPSQVWVYCYYSDFKWDLLRAANTLNIKTIEYQHSVISDNHFAYIKWEHIDEYSKFFPKYFWVWSEEDKKLIDNNFTGYTYKPVVEVTGNLYLEQELSNFSTNFSNNRNVLVILQGQWIPDFVEKVAIESTEIMWYFRLHPRYPHDKERLLSFASCYPDRVNIDEANNMLLYDLFGKVSTVIVMFSTVAVEAYKFGLKTIIVGEEGYSSYESYIKNEKFFYAGDAKELSRLLAPKLDK